jgi:hypothetical protein
MVGNQLDAQFFYNTFIYLNPLHVSSNYVLIFRRTCMNTTFVKIILCSWPSGMQVKMGLQRYFHPDLHTGRPLTKSDFTRSCVNTIVFLRIFFIEFQN